MCWKTGLPFTPSSTRKSSQRQFDQFFRRQRRQFRIPLAADIAGQLKWPAGARFGNSDDEKIVPRILKPSIFGINMPKPWHGCATSSRRKPSTTLATGG